MRHVNRIPENTHIANYEIFIANLLSEIAIARELLARCAAQFEPKYDKRNSSGSPIRQAY